MLHLQPTRQSPEPQILKPSGLTTDFDGALARSTNLAGRASDNGEEGDRPMSITPEHILAAATLISAVAGLVWSLRRQR